MNKIIQIFRYLVFVLLYITGIPFIIRELFQKDKITIIAFHDIPSDSSDRIFKYLLKKYNIIPLKWFVDLVEKGSIDKKSIPSKALIITIDDGLKQNFNLLKNIKKYKIPVTIFLTTGIIGTNRGFWWNHNNTTLSTENLKKISDKERLIKLEESGFLETKELDSRESLSFNEIEKMSFIVDFQSHSVTHPILPLCDDKKAYYEIEESKKFLISNFSFDIYAFAYPNGNYSKREEKMIKSSGYLCALTTDIGFNKINTDLFKLNRLSCGRGESVIETAVKTSGLWGKIKY